jgi:hypothetical protein
MGRVSADSVKIAPAWGCGKASTSRSANAIRARRSGGQGCQRSGCRALALRILAPLLVSHVNRIPDEWKGSPGLAAMLGPKAEQHDAAFAIVDFGERDLVSDLVFAEKPAGT